jgi:hypothetical protein
MRRVAILNIPLFLGLTEPDLKSLVV